MPMSTSAWEWKILRIWRTWLFFQMEITRQLTTIDLGFCPLRRTEKVCVHFGCRITRRPVAAHCHQKNMTHFHHRLRAITVRLKQEVRWWCREFAANEVNSLADEQEQRWKLITFFYETSLVTAFSIKLNCCCVSFWISFAIFHLSSQTKSSRTHSHFKDDMTLRRFPLFSHFIFTFFFPSSSAPSRFSLLFNFHLSASFTSEVCVCAMAETEKNMRGSQISFVPRSIVARLLLHFCFFCDSSEWFRPETITYARHVMRR